MEFFALDDAVQRLEAAIPGAGGSQQLMLSVALAWQLRQRDTSRAVALAGQASTMLADAALPQPDARRVEARLALVLGEAKWLFAELDAAEALARSALAGFGAIQDATGCADARWLLAMAAADRGDLAAARAAPARRKGNHQGHRHEFQLPNGRTFRLNVWDFGGQEIYHATHQFFLTHRSLYLLLDDTRASHKAVTDPYFRNWLDMIETFGGDSPVLLFQNEKDGRSKEIDWPGIKGKYPNVRTRHQGNLEHPNAADPLCAAIEHHASTLSHIGEELPARWIQVRKEIETRADQTPHISQQEYFDIYARHLPADRTKALYLSRYLHDLGVFLHFQDDPLLARTVILQNEWATAAVYRMLDDETVKAVSGRFTRSDCQRIWQESIYADMHPELLALMQRFELCYALPDCTPPAWQLPALLPAARPAALKEWGQADDLTLRYRYSFMPKGIISRLMVRQHRFVRAAQAASVNCVLFERDRTIALAELLDNGQEIELRARGPERKALLSVLAADLDAINDGFPGLRGKIEKLIPCNCTQCAAVSAPVRISAQRDRPFRPIVTGRFGGT